MSGESPAAERIDYSGASADTTAETTTVVVPEVEMITAMEDDGIVVGGWERLMLRCAYSHARLTDPARTEQCQHAPRCNYESLRRHCIGKNCPCCAAVIGRTGSVQREAQLQELLVQLPDGIDAAWVRFGEGKWEVQVNQPTAFRDERAVSPGPARTIVDVRTVVPARAAIPACSQKPLQLIKQATQGAQDCDLLRQAIITRAEKPGPLLLQAACDGLCEYVSLLLKLNADPPSPT